MLPSRASLAPIGCGLAVLSLGACDDPEPKCVKSPLNCAFDNGGGNRVKRKGSTSELWSVSPALDGAPTVLRDGNGAAINVWDESKLPDALYSWKKTPNQAQFNWGQVRTLAGKQHALATYSPNDSAAWFPIDAIVDKPEFMAQVGKETLDGKKFKKMGCYTVRSNHNVTYGELKVTKPKDYDEKYMRAADYLPRPRWPHGQRSVNLVFNVPGSGLGGTAIDHFPAKTRFQRVQVEMFDDGAPPSIEIPLYKKDAANMTWVKSQKTMKFIFGYVTTKTGEKRYGWMALEALKPGCVFAQASGYDGVDPLPPPPPPPDPQEPPPDPQEPPPDPPEPEDPCSQCVNTQCGGTLATCEANTQCQAIYDCVDGCPDACLSCWPGCWQQHPDGRSAFDAHQPCLQQHCYAACNTDDPCYDQTIACNNNPECSAIFACINATCPKDCPPDNPSCALPCWAGCTEQHPTAKEQFLALTQCNNSGCMP